MEQENGFTKVVVGDYEFSPLSGELRNVLAEENSSRLPPQPAKLLALLIRKNGEVVSQQEICQEIWGEADIDHGQSLHFCVRQARSALGDSASEPKYIETIPRRGYRLIAQCRSSESTGQNSDPPPISNLPNPQEHAQKSSHLVTFAGLIALTAIALGWFLFGNGVSTMPTDTKESQVSTIRVAVMPFIPNDGAVGHFETDRIAELLLLGLFDENANPKLSIVGPSTTEAYDSSPGSLKSLIDRCSLDYVINGRFVESDGKKGLLAELIRATDGAHIWVAFYDGTESQDEVASSIIENVQLRLIDALENG